jgi:ribosomal protein L7/L12
MKAPSAIEIALLMFLVITILFMLLQWRLSEIARRIGVVSRIDAKLDLLLKQAGIEYDPYKNLPPDVIDAVRRGAKIEAIKRYREATGTALKEAKQFIEEVQRKAGIGGAGIQRM